MHHLDHFVGPLTARVVIHAHCVEFFLLPTDTKTDGVYRCRACGAELFRSDAKFESHCGWPSFYQPSESDAVVLIEDRSLGTIRTEVRCAACDSHLGHVFTGEGYEVPTDQRWCINSVSLNLEPAKSEAP